jgi:hypothetical protein
MYQPQRSVQRIASCTSHDALVTLRCITLNCIAHKLMLAQTRQHKSDASGQGYQRMRSSMAFESAIQSSTSTNDFHSMPLHSMYYRMTSLRLHIASHSCIAAWLNSLGSIDLMLSQTRTVKSKCMPMAHDNGPRQWPTPMGHDIMPETDNQYARSLLLLLLCIFLCICIRVCVRLL